DGPFVGGRLRGRSRDRALSARSVGGPMAAARSKRVLPGFGLSLGFTLIYLSLIVLIPLSAVFIKSAGMGLEAFLQTVTSPRVVASYRLSFGASLLAAAINLVFGLLLAWALVRYSF